MSGVIYSQALYNANHTTVGSTVVYTVPANTTVVVTDIDGIFTASAVNQVQEVVLKQAIVAFILTAAGGNTPFQWKGRQVLNAGDKITLVMTGLASHIAITGYVLGP
jgi:hypothetical protein